MAIHDHRGLSVVIPCYNAGTFLLEAIQSVLHQSVKNPVEVVVVDDGSDEPTTSDVLAVVEQMPSVRVLRSEANQGVQHARNWGVRAASHDFIMPLDADDRLTHNPAVIGGGSYPDLAMSILQADDNVAFVHTMSRMFGAFDGLTISSYPCREELVLGKHHVPTSIVYRRADALAGAMYDPRVIKWQDWSFAVALLHCRWRRGLGNQIGFIHGPFHEYRVHSRASRLSTADVDEYQMTLITVAAHLELFKIHYACNEGAEEIARRVLSMKPSRLLDLLFMASYDLDLAINVASERQFDLRSPFSSLGIP